MDLGLFRSGQWLSVLYMGSPELELTNKLDSQRLARLDLFLFVFEIKGTRECGQYPKVGIREVGSRKWEGGSKLSKKLENRSKK